MTSHLQDILQKLHLLKKQQQKNRGREQVTKTKTG